MGQFIESAQLAVILDQRAVGHASGWHPGLAARLSDLREDARCVKRVKVASFGAEQAVRTSGGYRVKSLNGFAPTPEQLESLTRAVAEIETLVGPLNDLFQWSGLTIVHTDGRVSPVKFWPRDTANGSYQPWERVLCAGYAKIAALGHEWAHWLDFEAGYAASTFVEQTFGLAPTHGARSHVFALSNGCYPDDPTYQARGLTEQIADLIARARSLMSIPGEQEAVVRPNYPWNSPVEIWARLVEEYLARNLSDPSEVAYPLCHYWSFYWKKGPWAQLESAVASTLATAIAFLRARITSSKLRAA